jgi:hypothetical protein
MGAKGEVPRGLRNRQAYPGLEPLAILIHQADQGHWSLANVTSMGGAAYQRALLDSKRAGYTGWKQR